VRHLPVAAAMAAATALCVGTAVPASAADTTTTFAITPGLLTISAPTSKSLGSGAAGRRIGASLGSVTVNDARGLIGAAWTASVSSSDFSNTTTPAAPVIGKAAVSYTPGPATTTGTATVTPGTPGSLAAPRTAYSATATGGNNSATWNPTVTVTPPDGAISGSYSGTITYSVS